jgi:cytochrome c-type biogenesis protein
MLEFILYGIAALLSGLLTFLSPCTLPLVPGFFAYPGRSEHDKIKNTLFFSFGIASTLTVLGFFAGSLGSLVLVFKRQIMFSSGLFFIAISLLTLSGISIRFPGIELEKSPTFLGSFIFGGLMGLTWSGCIGPVLGFILVLAANTQTALSGAFLLFVYSLGMILPLLAFSLILTKIPKTGIFSSMMKGKLIEVTVFKEKKYLHTTTIISAILFLVYGLFLFFESSFSFTRFIAPWLTNWVFNIEEVLAKMLGIKLW